MTSTTSTARSKDCGATSEIQEAVQRYNLAQPGNACRELAGGPLDGQLLDGTGWSGDELECGAALITNLGHYGGGGRAHYEPRPGDPARCDWAGDSA
ncbi:hypothetical protein [Kitasatospora cineracea]|uniref:hypothetical protein n=1 Tax=Kitasatospora cineracea TaxID=88074 RepID=UPI003F4D6BD0